MKKLLVFAAVAAVLSSMLFTVHVRAQPTLSNSVGAKIAPSATGKGEKAVLRTPADIAAAEKSLGPATPVDIPFMPTDDPVEYSTMKAVANAQAAAADRSFGVEPLTPILEPPTLRGVSYDGLSRTPAGGAFPPDTHGAVGHTHFVEIVNVRMTAFNKANPGAQQCTFTLQALFGSAEFTFDPRVVYDQVWRRWVMVATRRSTSATDTIRRLFLAVSRTADPCGAYWVYSVNFGGGPFDNGDWWDYPGLGMDQDAVLITGNVFDTPTGPFMFAAMMPIAKARIYNGLGFSVPVFAGLAGTLQPPIVLDQNKDAYFVAANNNTHLHLYRGENLSNAGEATLVLQALVDVPDYGVPPDAPQLGTSQLLDTLDRRFVNNSTQVGDSLWNVHTINSGGRARPKFYEIDTEGVGANTVKQQGFFFESAISHDFNASIAANALGEAFVTWNSTDTTNLRFERRHNARIRFSGRQPADALGFIGAGSVLFTSSTALTGNPSSTSGVQRWGDYSAVSLDPSPGTTTGCTANRRAWIVNEKIDSTTEWGSRIGRIGFCD